MKFSSLDKFLYSFLFSFFSIINVNANVDFTNPTSTPPGTTTPNLSITGEDAEDPQLATDYTGQYVYVIWFLDSSSIIQVAISNDFGVTFSNPTSTPPGTTTPNLSKTGGTASFPQITTDSTGKYVYATWQFWNGLNYVIQVAISNDFGVTWTNPTSTPSGTTPNLSKAGESSFEPQITTDDTGRFVYALWRRANVLNDTIIQVAISSNYGITWVDPLSTPGIATPDLSVTGPAGEWAREQQIITDSTGRHIYATWKRYNGSDAIIQVAISSDFGVTWTDPSSTPSGIPPNLSDLGPPGGNASDPQIKTDRSGKYVYAIWRRSNGSKFIIQVAISNDYGANWTDPISTPGTATPDLSIAGQNTFKPQITAALTGEHVYAIWQIFNGFNRIIQVAISSDFGVNWTNPSSTPAGIGTPNLSKTGGNAWEPQISTDRSGKYIYAIWRKSSIQMALSNDYGVTWTDPNSTPPGTTTPDLSGPSSRSAQVITSKTGQHIYVAWYITLSYDFIQVAIAFNDAVSLWDFVKFIDIIR